MPKAILCVMLVSETNCICSFFGLCVRSIPYHDFVCLLVSDELRPVIGTLTKLYEDTSRALGAPNAVAARKREIDDNSKRIGALFAKLNNADISPNAASKLVQLCQALDKGDISAALHIQVCFDS